jgi:hypothetical protein
VVGDPKHALGEEEAEQVPTESPDLTAAVVRLRERLICIASVYVGGGNASALDGACNHYATRSRKYGETRARWWRF